MIARLKPKRWRGPLVAFLSLLISGCGPQDPLALSFARVQETMRQFDIALETINAGRLVPLLSPTVIATFRDARSGMLHFYEGREYITLLRDVLENTDNYTRNRQQTNLVIHPSGRSAQVTSRVYEHIHLSGRTHTVSERETVTIELIDGKAVITAVQSEPID